MPAAKTQNYFTAALTQEKSGAAHHREAAPLPGHIGGLQKRPHRLPGAQSADFAAAFLCSV